MIRSTILAVSLFFAPAVFAVDPVAADAADKQQQQQQDPAVFDAKVVFTELVNYMRSTKKPEATEVGSRADKVKVEADKVLADAAVADGSKQEVLSYSLVGYLLAASLDATTYMPKLQTVVADTKARYPKSKIASLGEAYLLQLEMVKLDSAGFLSRIKDFAAEYPKSDLGPQLVMAYAEKLSADAEATKKFLDEALVIFPKQAALTKLRETFDLVGKPAALVGPTIDGKAFDIKDWAGKVVVIDFWATWCAPCKAMTPKLIKFYEDMNAKGVEIVGVSLDSGQDEVEQYVSDHKVPWTQVFYPAARKRGSVAQVFGVSGIPTLFIVGKDGKFASLPTHSFEDMEAVVIEALKK